MGNFFATGVKTGDVEGIQKVSGKPNFGGGGSLRVSEESPISAR